MEIELSKDAKREKRIKYVYIKKKKKRKGRSPIKVLEGEETKDQFQKKDFNLNMTFGNGKLDETNEDDGEDLEAYKRTLGKLEPVKENEKRLEGSTGLGTESQMSGAQAKL